MQRKLPGWVTRRVALAMLVIGAVAVLLALFAYGSTVVGSWCVDGWESNSTGAGACSSHGGVASDRQVDTLIGQEPPGWVGTARWPIFVLGSVGAITGVLGLGSTLTLRSRLKGVSAATKTAERNTPVNPSALFAGTYVELAVDIDVEPNSYSVEVSTPSGVTRRSLRSGSLPADRGVSELHRLLEQAGRRRFGSATSKAVEAFGTDLFHAIFVGPVEQAYRDSVDFVRAHNCALRIALNVDESVADVPWEYLYDPDRGTFLALSRETSVVRVAEIQHTTRTQPTTEKLRILVMTASPKGLQALDVGGERCQIEQALAEPIGAGTVDLHFVDGGTQSALLAALANVRPHIFHFVGHGHWSDEHDDGVVLFEDDGGFQQPVTGRALGALLNGSDLRLAIFNSCHAARSSKSDRFAGISASLVAQGVPAALGMQYRFDDKAAVSFGSTLLQHLASGAGIDTAVTEARLAVFTMRNEPEWGTPVLTTRTGIEAVLPRLISR